MERHPTPNLDRHAGVFDRRFEALLVDGLLVGVVVALLGYTGGVVLVDGALGGWIGAIVALQFAALPALLLYQSAFEGYYGMTVGKYLRGIVVVQADGSPITWRAAVVRNVLRPIDSLPVFYLVGIVAAYATDDHQRVGDVAGGTVVVYTGD